jgi:hypothetical protein
MTIVNSLVGKMSSGAKVVRSNVVVPSIRPLSSRVTLEKLKIVCLSDNTSCLGAATLVTMTFSITTLSITVKMFSDVVQFSP